MEAEEKENETELMFRFDVLAIDPRMACVTLGSKIVNRPENMFREQRNIDAFVALRFLHRFGESEELRRTETASSLTLLHGKRIKPTENHFNKIMVVPYGGAILCCDHIHV